MRKYKLLVVEDNPEQVEILERNLSSFKSVIDLSKLKIATSYTEALTLIATGEVFDLSILDKFLDEGTCFELIKACGRNPFGTLIFNTASDEDLKHLEETSNLGDYHTLSNKYYLQSLALTFAKVIPELNSKEDIAIREESHTFLLPTGTQGKFTKVLYRDVVVIEVEKKYCYIHYSDVDKKETKISILEKTLDYYENLLEKHNFFRIHDKYLLNLKFVKSVDKKDKQVTLSMYYAPRDTGTEKKYTLDVAERRFAALCKKLDTSTT